LSKASPAASSIVEPSTAVPAVPFHGHEHRVPTRDEQHDCGQLELGLFEHRRVHVGLEMVHADEGDVPHEGQRLGSAHPDEQRADETRANRGRDGVDLVVVDARFDHRLRDDGGEELDVSPARNLGHDTAVAGVQVHLTRHDRRQDGERLFLPRA